MYRFSVALLALTFVFSINAQDLDSEPKVDVQTLSGEEVIEIIKPLIWDRQIDGDDADGENCIVDLLVSSDDQFAMIMFRQENGAPVNYTESNQSNPGTFWFAHGFNYIYTKTDFSTEDDGEGFYVHHTFQPALAPESYSVTIQEAGDSYYELDITKNGQEVSRKELCNIDF